MKRLIWFGVSLTRCWRKADSNPWSQLHRRRLRDRRLVHIRVPAGETNSFKGGTDGSNPLSSTGESVLACDQPRNQTPNHQSSPVLILPIGADQDPTETGIRVGKSSL